MTMKFSRWLAIREDAAAVGAGGGAASSGGSPGGTTTGGSDSPSGDSTPSDGPHDSPDRTGATMKGGVAPLPMRIGCCGCGYSICKCKKKKKRKKRKGKKGKK